MLEQPARVIGGLLTATVGWQAVFLINVPLAAIAVAITLTAIPSDIHQANTAKIDVPGAVLLAVGITALIVGLSQSQNWGWDSLAVWRHSVGRCRSGRRMA